MTNIVLLVGNLGADPELRSANNGTDIAIFNLGTSRPRRDAEGKTYKDASGFTAKDTEWHRVTCFNGLGRIVAQHVTKGMLVSVRGRIHYSKWTDREGVERTLAIIYRAYQAEEADEGDDAGLRVARAIFVALA
jgi:single-strand DNA-binding protein